MINCKNHFIEKWVERIIGKSRDDKDFKEYITKNREQIQEHANTTFDHSKHIFKGQIGDNTTKNYYIKDDTVLVTNTDNNALITVYKVDLGFPDDLNKTVRKGLVEEIDRISEEQKELDEKIDKENEDREFQLSKNQEEIDRLKEKMDNLESENKLINEEIKNEKLKSTNMNLDKKKYVLMLVNSKEYKREIQEANK